MTESAGAVSITIDADDLLRATSEVMPLLEEYVKDALHQGVVDVASWAAAPANHDYQDRTEFLSGSIGGSLPTGSLAGNDLSVDFVAGGQQVYYAKYIEFGTRHIRPGVGYRFMRNAVDAKAAEVADSVQAAVERAIFEAGL